MLPPEFCTRGAGRKFAYRLMVKDKLKKKLKLILVRKLLNRFVFTTKE
jgi:hypothetical protein